MSGVTAITPAGSSAPVFLDTTPFPPVVPPDLSAAYNGDLASAVSQLVSMGLTEDAARAVARYQGPLTDPAS